MAVIAVTGVDADAEHGVWNEAIVMAPQPLIDELATRGKVVLLPSAEDPEWTAAYDAFDEIVVQGHSAFETWLEREAQARGIKTWRAGSSVTAP